MLSFRIEAMMDNLVKELIVNTYQCVQIENDERQKNMILETLGNYKSIRDKRKS